MVADDAATAGASAGAGAAGAAASPSAAGGRRCRRPPLAPIGAAGAIGAPCGESAVAVRRVGLAMSGVGGAVRRVAGAGVRRRRRAVRGLEHRREGAGRARAVRRVVPVSAIWRRRGGGDGDPLAQRVLPSEPAGRDEPPP